jgi:hypothetical protein
MDISFIAISSIATIVIAIYAWLNYKLISKIHFFNLNLTEFNDNNRRRHEAKAAANHSELTDILKAVVISNLLANKNSLEQLKTSIDLFHTEYFGHTQIFSSEAKQSIKINK